MKAAFVLLLAGTAVPAMAQTDPHAGHDMSMPMDGARTADNPHAGHTMPTPQPVAVRPDGARGTDQVPGQAAPPPVQHDSQADRFWDPQAMAAAAKAEMMPPRPVYRQVIFDLAELRAHRGRNGYAWEAEAWWGDLDRLTLKSRGEGALGADLEHGEVEVLYSKALDPWWNLQAGLRQDFGAGPDRTWATIGVEGRAPYQLHLQGALYLSDKGQLTARIEAAHDLRLTQRAILQPRAELELSAQDMPRERIGAGLAKAELGLRLRYELTREFAPYVGVVQTWAVGATARYARLNAEHTRQTSAVAGVRFWF